MIKKKTLKNAVFKEVVIEKKEKNISIFLFDINILLSILQRTVDAAQLYDDWKCHKYFEKKYTT